MCQAQDRIFCDKLLKSLIRRPNIICRTCVKTIIKSLIGNTCPQFNKILTAITILQKTQKNRHIFPLFIEILTRTASRIFTYSFKLLYLFIIYCTFYSTSYTKGLLSYFGGFVKMVIGRLRIQFKRDFIIINLKFSDPASSWLTKKFKLEPCLAISLEIATESD